VSRDLKIPLMFENENRLKATRPSLAEPAEAAWHAPRHMRQSIKNWAFTKKALRRQHGCWIIDVTDNREQR